MKYDEPQDIWAGVPVCQYHTGDTPVDYEQCEGCSNEIAARGAVLDQMNAEAGERAKSLAQNGVPVPQEVMQAVKIDVLLDSILTDPKHRLRYEGEVGRRLMLMIKNMQTQVAGPSLHLPPNVRPLKKQ